MAALSWWTIPYPGCSGASRAPCPELIEEVLTLIEHRIAEMNGDDGAAPRPTAESVAIVKPEVVARFAAVANAERMGFGEFLEHIMDVHEESRKREEVCTRLTDRDRAVHGGHR
jgi:hypothetical protein